MRTISDEQVDRMTEEDAHALMCRLRWPDGKPVCPRCGKVEHSWIATRKQFQCSNPSCRHRFSVTSGTVWDNRKFPLRRILKVAHHIATSPMGVSSSALAEKMSIQEKTAYVMLNKFREALVAVWADHKVSGEVEIDGVYFCRSRRRTNCKRLRQMVDWDQPKDPCFLTIAQRSGPVIPVLVEGETGKAILAAVAKHV